MTTGPRLDHDRHVKYFLRCLKTLLPTQYTPTDGNRMSLAFFIVSALDLLDALEPNTGPGERQEYIDWVYLNQHDDGGFRAFTGANLGGADGNNKTSHWAPPTLSATYFALTTLLILGDDLARVRRTACLDWLRTLQRPSGGFGDMIVDGDISGGHDARFGYCAAAVWCVLGAHLDPDCCRLDRDGFARYIRSVHTYDGGIADVPYHESHAGFTFCAIAALNLFDSSVSGLTDVAQTVHWLVSRQTANIYQDQDVVQEEPLDKPVFSGFNGRLNKTADTCYAFWVTGALAILNQSALIDDPSLRRWLLSKTANEIMGGFGKHAGDRPDLHHSYLGLAALALTACPDDSLQTLDAAMCISQRAKGRLENIWRRWGLDCTRHES